jgi:tRNA (mo5U34)-methyltransferase
VIDFAPLWRTFEALDIGGWRALLEPMVSERLSDSAHGDLRRWRRALDQLPAADEHASEQLLLELVPWRKGPFRLGGIEIDAEWRSDLKWQRVMSAIEPLDGRRVLDVGCGNGYYSLKMREAGASAVIGIDPTLLYVIQFAAVTRFSDPGDVFVLPLRLQDLPGEARAFDTTFSMGVLYHQRSPIEHLLQLRDTLRPGGQLVLETLYLPGERALARTPPGRYARMRNVWLLPTVAELETWLRRCGFRSIAVTDRTRTTTDEQRTTRWMPFESLREALDPDDPAMTVEGWPAPRRVVVIAKVP